MNFISFQLNATDSNIVTRPSGLHECTSEHSLSDEDLVSKINFHSNNMKEEGEGGAIKSSTFSLPIKLR